MKVNSFIIIFLLIQSLPSIISRPISRPNCKEYWKVPVAETATITFNSELLSGRFVLYDNLKGSGTQIKGLFDKGLVRKRWLPPSFSYKFVAYMESNCDKLSDNAFYQFDVTDSFLPRQKGLIDERGGMKSIVKTTMFSWYWGPNIKMAIAVYENEGSKRREIWKKITCTEVVSKPDTSLSHILGDDAIDDDD